jgi:hypothetical protein
MPNQRKLMQKTASLWHFVCNKVLAIEKERFVSIQIKFIKLKLVTF